MHGLALLCLDGQLATVVDDGRDSVMNLVDRSVSCLIAGYQSNAVSVSESRANRRSLVCRRAFCNNHRCLAHSGEGLC